MFKSKSIQSRVLLYSGLLIVGLVVLITTIFYMTERQRLLEERMNVISLEVARESAYIEREFSKIYENTQSLSLTAIDMIEHDYDEERVNLFSISERLLDGNPNIVGVNLVFEENVIGQDIDFAGDTRFQSDGQFVSYISKIGGQLNIQYIPNYETYEFYTNAVLLKDDFFTEPYYFTIRGEESYVSTVVFPIVLQGEFLGLVGIDFTAEYIFEQMMQLRNEYDRRDIIVSQEGTILLNTKDQTYFGSDIASIHPNYESDLAEVDRVGQIIGRAPNGDFEVVKIISLASTGDNWYIFSDIDSAIVLGDLNSIFLQTSAIGLIALLLGLIAIYFISISLTSPIKNLSTIVEDYDAKSTSINVFDIDTKGLHEIELLRDNFKSTLRIVQQNLYENKRSIDLQAKQISIQKALESRADIKELSSAILDVMIKETNAMIGGFYIYKDEELHLNASSGLKKDAKKTIHLGEGLVGRVAQTEKPMFFHYSEDATNWVDFGLDDTNPPHIVIYPLVQDNQLVAVLQLISLNQFDDLLEDLLDESAFMITASIVKQQSVEQTDTLLKETQTLAQELDKKQQDLNVQNEELESQQEELRVTNEELETQQEELRVTNEELQDNMEQVELINKELENARKELEKRTVDAEQSNKYKSEFLANMSHELRTPLNSILILSNLISEQQISEEKTLEYAGIIHSSGSDLLELINGILDLSKVEAGKEHVNIRDTNLEVLTKELTQRFDPLADKSNIDLVINKSTETNSIRTDATKLKLILTNLLSNAVKFTEKGSVTLDIVSGKDNIIFEVTDTGIGIDTEKLESIFEEFHQVESDSRRSFGGTGLGLSICKQYAKLLQGRITVESTPGEGSVFRLILPMRMTQDEVKNSKVKEERESHTRSSEDGVIADDRHNIALGDHSILVIDDNVDFLRSMRDFFRSQDVNIIVSETGENGLFLADYYGPNIILVDEQLPKMNGQKVVKRLKANPRNSGCKSYIVSGKANQDEIEGAPFISKPMSDKVLKDIVKELKEMPTRTGRILLIEDDKTHQQAVLDYLNNQKSTIDYEIDTVATKKETMKYLKENHYELLVVDLGLSDASEFELIKEIRRKEQYKKLPIIVYTGKEFNSEEEEELFTMVQDIIIKGDQSSSRLLNDIELFMSQKDKRSLVTDKTLFQGKKVLVVDDDIRNIFALTGLLEAYDVDVVYNTLGKDAIERLKKEDDIDLVLMDIMMPEMNGYETMEKIRNEEKKTDLPIIALTAKNMRGDREKCIEAGANEYLSKPINKDKLLSVLRVWMP